VIANEISDMRSWAKLEEVLVLFGFEVTHQGVCLATIGIDPAPVRAMILCGVKVDIWRSIPSKVLVEPAVHFLLRRHPSVPSAGKDIVYPNGGAINLWPEFYWEVAKDAAHSCLVDSTRSFCSTCWFVGVRWWKLNIYSLFFGPGLKLGVSLIR
jgi:hypothetical protein